MITTSDFKTGLVVEYEGNVYQVVEFQHVKPGKGQAFVRCRLRNLRTGSLTDYSFEAGTKMESAEIEKKKMQYLYNDGFLATFMDLETYEQIDISMERLKWELQFMLEGNEVTVLDYKGEVLGVQLIEKTPLKVTECAPGVKGNTAANATKVAIVETGLRVIVPLFIAPDDLIIVSTIDGKYCGRA